MGLIKNSQKLAITPERATVLEIIEAGLAAIQPEENFGKTVKLEENILSILGTSYDLSNFEHIYLIGFGKGSARNSKLLEDLLGDRLTEGYVIDTKGEEFKTIKFTQGTHPVVSQQNVDFTFSLMDRFSKMTDKDLVLVVICGGGSAMLEHPHSVSVEQKIEIEKALLKSGATIIEMNKIRQHLSDVKGGGLAQILYPATIASLIYSDVPGNDISYIASGPTVKDSTSIEDAMVLIRKFQIPNVYEDMFINNPQDDKYFEKVKNHIVLSNLTALNAMRAKCEEKGLLASIVSDKFESEAKEAYVKLKSTATSGIILAGGETTVTVHGEGKGGRNQEAVVGSLASLDDNEIFASIDSDGWDNSEHAGAIADKITHQHATENNLNPEEFLKTNNSFDFFQESGDAIVTDRLPSNVADILLLWKL